MDAYLEADSIIKSFGKYPILTDVCLHCRPGDIIGIFGRNGTGKSTLLKIIFGTMKSERSFVRINGKVVTGKAFTSGKIAYLPQHPFLPMGLKISKLIELYLPDTDPKKILGDMHLFKYRNMKVAEMSGGSQRYLEIKLLLNLPAPFILLDEPFYGLSPIAAESVRSLIREQAQTKGIILTDHNYREVHKIANQLMLLHEGYLRKIHHSTELIAYGYYEE